jgi:hypothetical protein
MLRTAECPELPCSPAPAKPQFLNGAPAIRIRRNFMKTNAGYVF